MPSPDRNSDADPGDTPRSEPEDPRAPKRDTPPAGARPPGSGEEEAEAEADPKTIPRRVFSDFASI